MPSNRWTNRSGTLTVDARLKAEKNLKDCLHVVEHMDQSAQQNDEIYARQSKELALRFSADLQKANRGEISFDTAVSGSASAEFHLLANQQTSVCIHSMAVAAKQGCQSLNGSLHFESGYAQQNDGPEVSYSALEGAVIAQENKVKDAFVQTNLNATIRKQIRTKAVANMTLTLQSATKASTCCNMSFDAAKVQLEAVAAKTWEYFEKHELEETSSRMLQAEETLVQTFDACLEVDINKQDQAQSHKDSSKTSVVSFGAAALSLNNLACKVPTFCGLKFIPRN